MFDVERREQILEVLRKEKSCSVKKLAKLLNFSESTIRRDLNALDAEMKIKKTFGGAVIREEFGAEVPISLRKAQNTDLKRALAREAAKLIKNNYTVFLAASSTVEQIVPYLSIFSGLTIITNSQDIPQMLANTNINVYSTGGRYLHHSNSYVGEYAREMISNINADLVIFSARGVSADGRVTNSSTEDDVIKTMIKNSKHTCLMVTGDKVGQTYPFTICHVKDLDTVISDKYFVSNEYQGEFILLQHK